MRDGVLPPTVSSNGGFHVFVVHEPQWAGGRPGLMKAAGTHLDWKGLTNPLACAAQWRATYPEDSFESSHVSFRMGLRPDAGMTTSPSQDAPVFLRELLFKLVEREPRRDPAF